MENNSNDIVIEYTDTITANSISGNCGTPKAICCNDTQTAQVCAQGCDCLKSDYDELCYVTKFKKYDEYCCVKKAPQEECYCEKPQPSCCEQPQQNCCKKPQPQCCEKPRQNCCQSSARSCYPITKTAMKCGCPGSTSIPTATALGTTQTITALSIDSSSFDHPCVQLSFAASINTTAAVIGLNFQVFKQCKCQLTATPVGGVYTFSRAVAVTDSDSFNFTVCDCDSCMNECCTYTVVITTTVASVGVTSISNATLSAVITDQTCKC